LDDNIKMGLKDIGWKVLDPINLPQDRNQWWAVVNTKMNLRTNLLSGCALISFSRRTVLHGVGCLID
jgi:hypothetical protein